MKPELKQEQLVLPISFRKQDSFDNFVEGNNTQLISHIKMLIQGNHSFNNSSQRMSYIQGLQGAGKTHLLLAACEYASRFVKTVQYIDLINLQAMPPSILLGLTNKDLVCIDNIHIVDNSFEWQRAVFDVINQFIENEKDALLLTSSKHVQSLHFPLPDLKTRLTWGVNFSLLSLKDDEKLRAIASHMDVLGLRYSDDVPEFVLKRCSRDMKDLSRIVTELDKSSLQSKRKITIPFVKKALAI